MIGGEGHPLATFYDCTLAHERVTTFDGPLGRCRCVAGSTSVNAAPYAYNTGRDDDFLYPRADKALYIDTYY